MKRPFTTSPQNRTLQGLVALVSLFALAGCQSTKPRYLSTWHRITSKHFDTSIPCCHGYTPTQWSRWPAECEPQEVIVIEDVPRPLPSPPSPDLAPPLAPSVEPPFPTEPEATSPPPPDDVPDIAPGEVIVPQQYEQPTLTGQPPTEIEKPKDVTWSAHLTGYFKAVTRVR